MLIADKPGPVIKFKGSSEFSTKPWPFQALRITVGEGGRERENATHQSFPPSMLAPLRLFASGPDLGWTR